MLASIVRNAKNISLNNICVGGSGVSISIQESLFLVLFLFNLLCIV